MIYNERIGEHSKFKPRSGERHLFRQNLIAIAVALSGIALAAFIAVTGPDIEMGEERQRIPAVPTMRVVTETVRMTVTSHGTVVPGTESDLVAEVPGRIVAVSPSMVAGGFFARHDMLARIESVDYEAGLEDAAAQLASARSELASAEKYFGRQRELAERKSISESQYDEAVNRLAVAKAALRRVVIGKARAERDLERTRLVAPYDGRVRTERIAVGQFVQRGDVLASLYSIESAEVPLPVRDEDLAFLPLSLAGSAGGVGPRARVLLRARFVGAEREWEGSIVRTEGELDATTRMVNLIARVDAPYGRSDAPPLVAGLFVQATILGHRYDGIATIPRSALQADERVYVVGDDNRLDFRAVDILRVAGDTAWVRGGLRDGEVICTEKWRDAIDGQLVRPIPAGATQARR